MYQFSQRPNRVGASLVGALSIMTNTATTRDCPYICMTDQTGTASFEGQANVYSQA